MLSTLKSSPLKRSSSLSSSSLSSTTSSSSKTRKHDNLDTACTNKQERRALADNNGRNLIIDSCQTLDKKSLELWGLPSKIVEKYKGKKVTSLFPWQLDCLTSKGVFSGQNNLVYSAPTSAGKTLIAEILMIKRVLEGKKAIMILPYVAVAREKVFYFKEIVKDVGIRVDGLMADYNPPGGFKNMDVAICTLERANALINRLLEDNTFAQVGIIVVDELYIIGEEGRGALLEFLLTKIKYVMSKQVVASDTPGSKTLSPKEAEKLNMQMCLMSATLPNLDALAKWLDAELVTTEFRPVPLRERMIVEDGMSDPRHSTFSNSLVFKDSLLDELKRIPGDTGDLIAFLSLETVLAGHSVLIFCPTKDGCEAVSIKIAQAFRLIGNPSSGSSAGAKLRQELSSERIYEVLSQLRESSVNKLASSALQMSVSYGVAFHHAGLTMDERDIIEAAFKMKTLRVIVATSTLAAGVNLPARRVIINSPIGHDGGTLDTRTYRQMIGRAGRQGIDEEGESILLCTEDNKKLGQKLVDSNFSAVRSTLLGNDDMKRGLMEAVATGIAKSSADIQAFIQCTLLSTDSGKAANHELIIDQCLEFLKESNLIKFMQKDKSSEKSAEYGPTDVGSACLTSSLSPDEAISIYKELQVVAASLVPGNDLHIIYLATPINLCNLWKIIDWHLFMRLPFTDDEDRIGKIIGVDEFSIAQGAKGCISGTNPQQVEKYNKHLRFFTARVLNELVNENPISAVAEKYQVKPPGKLLDLQQGMSTFIGMVTSFSNRLDWTHLELFLSDFQQRLQFGVRRELFDLIRMSRINVGLARILFDGGVKGIIDLAKAPCSTVEKILHPRSRLSHSGESGIILPGKNKIMTVEEASALLVDDAQTFLRLEVQPIIELRANASAKVTTKARVTIHSAIHYFSKPGDDVTMTNSPLRQMFVLDLLDATGEIRLTGFGNYVSKFYNAIEVNKVYYFRNLRVRNTTKCYVHDCELIYSPDSSITPCTDDDCLDVPRLAYDFKSISEIAELPMNSMVDVIGICKSHGKCQTTEKKKLKFRFLSLVDESNKEITVSVWGRNALREVDYETEPVIAVKRAKVQAQFRKNLNSSCLQSSTVQINPDFPEARALRAWFDNGGKLMPSTSLSVHGNRKGWN